MINYNITPIFDFKSKRKELGLTLRQVEKATGLSNAYLSQLENGIVKNPSYRVVKILHELYFDNKNLSNKL